jgi:hypothetical protein
MNFKGLFRKLAVGIALALAPAASFAGVFISVGFAPPALPVYVQPVCPGDGYLWNPGYWAYGDDGYYWVPGVWVQPPAVGLLWTPGYWGWGGGAYIFHEGYWGPHVGFYGGINYGFGFGGVGFFGGEWRGGHFAYNTAYSNVNSTVIHNTYINRTTINNTTINNTHTSFNGGTGGIQARPTAQEAQFEHENHIPPTAAQTSHIQAARAIPANYAKSNGGHPAMAAIQRPGALNTAVAARGANPANNTRQTGGFGSTQGRGTTNSSRPATQNSARQTGGFGSNQGRPNTAQTAPHTQDQYRPAPQQRSGSVPQQYRPAQQPRPQSAPRSQPSSHPAPHEQSSHGH